MKRPIHFLLLGLSLALQSALARPPADWLLDGTPFKAQVKTNAQPGEAILDNGLIRRVFRLAPNATTVGFENLMTGESLLRAVRPEALIEVDGQTYEVGGLSGQPVQNFLRPAWIDRLQANPKAFQFAQCRIGRTEARFAWQKRREWMPKDAPWPAPGVSLTLEYVAPAGVGGAESPSPNPGRGPL